MEYVLGASLIIMRLADAVRTLEHRQRAFGLRCCAGGSGCTGCTLGGCSATALLERRASSGRFATTLAVVHYDHASCASCAVRSLDELGWRHCWSHGITARLTQRRTDLRTISGQVTECHCAARHVL